MKSIAVTGASGVVGQRLLPVLATNPLDHPPRRPRRAPAAAPRPRPRVPSRRHRALGAQAAARGHGRAHPPGDGRRPDPRRGAHGERQRRRHPPRPRRRGRRRRPQGRPRVQRRGLRRVGEQPRAADRGRRRSGPTRGSRRRSWPPRWSVCSPTGATTIPASSSRRCAARRCSASAPSGSRHGCCSAARRCGSAAPRRPSRRCTSTTSWPPSRSSSSRTTPARSTWRPTAGSTWPRCRRWSSRRSCRRCRATSPSARCALTWQLGIGDVPPGVVPYLEHPWVIANDQLRGARLGAAPRQRGGDRRRAVVARPTHVGSGPARARRRHAHRRGVYRVAAAPFSARWPARQSSHSGVK